MRRRISSKSDTCTEGAGVYAAGISVKVGAHYPGRSVGLSAAVGGTTGGASRREGSAEVSRGHSTLSCSQGKARTCRSCREPASRCLVQTQMARRRCRAPTGRAADGIREGTGWRVKRHGEAGTTPRYGRRNSVCRERHEPPWYGTVCPVVWEEEGVTPPPARFLWVQWLTATSARQAVFSVPQPRLGPPRATIPFAPEPQAQPAQTLLFSA